MKNDFLRNNQKQISEFLVALKGRKEIPLKFEYLGDGAKKWDAIVKAKEYSLGKTETDLLKKYSKNIYKYCKNSNLFDLGCGNGIKVRELINVFPKNKKINYNALDISNEMIKLAFNNFKKLKSHRVSFNKIITDFESGNFARETRKIKTKTCPNNFMFLLGHTLGNPSDKNRVLMNIRESMSKDDKLLIGVEYIEKENIKKIIEHYNNDIVFNLFFVSLKRISIEKTDGKFKLFYNIKKHQIEAFFEFNKNVEIKIYDESIQFKKGDKILVAISTRFTFKKINKLLSSTGYKIIEIYKDEKNKYCLILCSPKIYEKNEN